MSPGETFLANTRLYRTLKEAIREAPCKILLLSVASILLAGLFYLPVIRDVLVNDYVASHGLFYYKTLTIRLPSVLVYFTSGRFLLVLLVGLGLIAGLRLQSRKKFLSRASLYGYILIFPFVFSAIRGDRPFDRTFLPLTVVFALLAALCIDQLRSFRKFPLKISLAITAILVIYCQVNFYVVLKNVDASLYQSILNGKKSQDIYYNYYLSYYSPLKILSNFANNVYRPGIPVFVFDFGDGVAIPEDIKLEHIPYEFINSVQNMYFTAANEVFVISAFPMNFSAQLAEQRPEVECNLLNEINYINVFRCQKP